MRLERKGLIGIVGGKSHQIDVLNIRMSHFIRYTPTPEQILYTIFAYKNLLRILKDYGLTTPLFTLT